MSLTQAAMGVVSCVPDFFDGRPMVSKTKGTSGYHQLKRRLKSRDAARLNALTASMVQGNVGALASASFTHVRGDTPVAVNFTTNAHRINGGLRVMTTVSVINRVTTYPDQDAVVEVFGEFRPLPEIRNYFELHTGDETTTGIRYANVALVPSLYRLDVNFFLDITPMDT